jgi:L-rhamnose mutarotase
VETVCVRVRLEPGSLPRVREWAAELNARRDEVLATLRDEGVRVESVFLDGETLVYYLKADSVDKARDVYAGSQHAIDAYHQRFKDETFAERTQLELLVDFENL